ncbi:uncharacterized protein KNAG_0D03610 [Huiozyma naganishii CBS 8797]|uniref:Uncharacterized protein n=1 Tax=Huiozyma naganishii (strain ATCC MYA-139 / BCRC 22969 / CBS 8797 / KCTC 17520 / NBRC 10181 / NCYC 3082 / Yp74L-3) TaxID=1071383 RepID=J7RY97_HUIN7|nr:hypothetical protein KNAG_0D03610 [Kazachstania naganishii CBS 8797]CCK70107.1 hypothetical protein KNAG_0D03610 [Kazachstania naganishii CBS 8797]
METSSKLSSRFGLRGKQNRPEINEIPGWDIGPLDSEEQEELIQQFELHNYSTNQWTINILSGTFLFCAGLFSILATKSERRVSCMLIAGVQSIACSVVSLRYDIINDFILFRQVRLRFSNSTLTSLNCVILTLILWVTMQHFEDTGLLQLFFQVPLLLFIITVLVKKWGRDIETELRGIRSLKYKYKNV